MPNWVMNYVTIITDDEETYKEIAEYVKGEDSVFDFDRIIKMPENIFRGNLGAKEREKYGKDNWYDWSIEHWGTKWNCCNAEKAGFSFTFETAWSAPVPVIKELSRQFPDVDIALDYADEDIGRNCGTYVFSGGVVVQEMDGDEEFASRMWGWDSYEDYTKQFD